ncbi:sodium-dependent transporter [Synechococcus sp. UW140]|uniref:sodium-dependent transporter n=1 Tax=Synechococcus sp. UW140 TaxID=368503 RepID=UPI000E0E2680|nr:sodium-dependent transporter [Synechococcus sp. UW140]
MAVKEHWRSNLGFVLAASGSAVGLGNLWGFAYRASQGGGGAFLLLYLLIVLVVCLPVLVAEMVLGRSTGQSPLLAPGTAADQRWRPLGWLFVVAACGILAFYAVLMGWTGTTLIHALIDGLPKNEAEATAFYDGLSGGRSALLGQGISLLLTACVVAAGIRGGIERLSRWGLPLLFVMLIGLVIWAGRLPDAVSGYNTFLLHWDAAYLFDLTTIRHAFEQAFFSIGTGIGCILCYSAYLDRRARLPREAVAIVGMDTAVGLLAGMVTFPIVMSFGLIDLVGSRPLGAIFIALPTGLSSLGGVGLAVAVIFFVLAYIAGITSAVSLLEVPVASLMDALGWNRSKAVCLSATLIFILGLPAATSTPVLWWMASVFGGVLLVLGGLLLCVLMGWVLPSRFQEDLSQSGSSPLLRRILLLALRWVSPPVVALGLVISVVDLVRSWTGAS